MGNDASTVASDSVAGNEYESYYETDPSWDERTPAIPESPRERQYRVIKGRPKMDASAASFLSSQTTRDCCGQPRRKLSKRRNKGEFDGMEGADFDLEPLEAPKYEKIPQEWKKGITEGDQDRALQWLVQKQHQIKAEQERQNDLRADIKLLTAGYNKLKRMVDIKREELDSIAVNLEKEIRDKKREYVDLRGKYNEAARNYNKLNKEHNTVQSSYLDLQTEMRI